MCLFCVLILLNCHLFICVLNLTFHISWQVFFFTELFQDKLVVLIKGMFKGKNAHSNLKRSLYS